MRLIDADVLEENMYHEAFEKDTDLQRWDSGCWIRYRMFTDVLKSTPTVEPSAQPDTDEWCEDCSEYDHEHHCCPRWSRVIRETLKDARPEPSQWIPASERLPEKGERATLRYSNGKISGGTYIGSRTFDVDFGDTDPAVSVVEWRPE